MTKSYNDTVRQGHVRPFECEDIIICSYQFARTKAAEISLMRWDLVVIDEAHRLWNVYKPTNVIANTLKHALKDAPKLLLTATPLQNSLLELYGLVSVVDNRISGDLKSFKEQFANLHNKATFETLKARLQPLCERTLRRQVLPYVRYTKRLPMMQPFTPAENEDRLYHLVSDYLRRHNLKALPSSQRSLMTLVLRKPLAPLSFAIAGALNSMSQRLRERLRQADGPNPLEEALEEDFESLDEIAEEWEEERAPPPPLTKADRKAIQQEIQDLEGFSKLPSRLLTMRRDSPSSPPCEQPSERRQSLGRLTRPSSSPSPDEPRSIYFESSLTVRGKTTSCSSMAPTMTRSRSSSIKGSSATKGQTGSRALAPPICAPPSWITSRTMDRS